ncbi:MAG: OmpA family protein [Planctomycetes bacterium]|nr:OmpA family protein [Planctomycetota bacterium]
MAVEEDPPAAVPEWVVSFGDMMSLLLTFFIMLVSMSEIRKDDDKFQAFLVSLKQKFGDDIEKLMLGIGTGQPPSTKPVKITTKKFAKWDNSTELGGKQKGAPGNESRVRNIRPGPQIAVGGPVSFAEQSAELSPEELAHLRRISEELAGKPQRIEIRGHTSRNPISLESPFRDHWDLAYARCRQVMQQLTGLGIEPARLRISVAALNEPVERVGDALSARENSRVELYLLGEVPNVTEPAGTSAGSKP